MITDLSIIIPVYNGSKYITTCLDSLLNQENIIFELILVNDASKDDSLLQMKKYNNDDRVKIIDLIENKGQGNARNVGITEAQGDYILFIDIDDYIEPNKTVLSHLIHLCREKDLDILDCAYNCVLDKNVIVKNNVQLDCQSGVDFLRNIDVLSVVVWNKIFSRKFIEANQLSYYQRKYEDVTFVIDSMLKAKKVQSSEIVFYNYIIQENSTMTAVPKAKNVNDAIELIKDLEIVFQRNKDVYQVEKNFLYSFIGAARIIDRYRGEQSEISQSLNDLNRLYKKNKSVIMRTNTLNFLLKAALLISPYWANRLLLKLKR